MTDPSNHSIATNDVLYRGLTGPHARVRDILDQHSSLIMDLDGDEYTAIPWQFNDDKHTIIHKIVQAAQETPDA